MSGAEHERPGITGWQVHLGSVPVAVRSAEPAWQGQEQVLLHDLAGGIAYGFDAVRAVWEEAHAAAGDHGLQDPAPSRARRPAMSVGDVTVSDRVVEAVLLVNAEAFAQTADADITAAQATDGRVRKRYSPARRPGRRAAASISEAWARSSPPSR